jgi:hypothetical protein
LRQIIFSALQIIFDYKKKESAKGTYPRQNMGTKKSTRCGGGSIYCGYYYRIVAPNDPKHTNKTAGNMNPPVSQNWDGIERRRARSCRRIAERRSSQERRSDRRESTQANKRSFSGWLRSLVKARLGVDRRKNIDRRKIANRRNPSPRSMLTKEELADLLR